MNENDILKENFIFISYTHVDKDFVELDTKALEKSGVRLWYDINMELGDNWQHVAEEKIKHPNCVGVIFYVSPESLASDAVQKEQNWTRERLTIDDNFKYWYILVGSDDIKAIYRRAADIYETKNPNADYDDVKIKQKSLFNVNILCITSQDAPTRTNEIYNKIALERGCVDNEYSVVQAKLDSIYYGKCIHVASSIHSLEGKENGIYEYGNEDIIVRDGMTYKAKPLLWDLLYVKDSTCVYISNQILDYSSYDEIEALLKNSFLKTTFTEEELEFNDIVVRLLEQKDVDNIAKEEALSTIVQKHWWTSIPGDMPGWNKTYIDGLIYDVGFPKHMKKGFRPVIAIKQNLLPKIKK